MQICQNNVVNKSSILFIQVDQAWKFENARSDNLIEIIIVLYSRKRNFPYESFMAINFPSF